MVAIALGLLLIVLGTGCAILSLVALLGNLMGAVTAPDRASYVGSIFLGLTALALFAGAALVLIN